MLPKTHLFIAKEALKLAGKKFKGYEKYIEQGCYNEDNIRLGSDYHIYGTDHFYHPFKKQGYFRFSGNAKEKGLHYFSKAVNLYNKNDQKTAFIFLGRCLHMLADMASPSHTKLEFHFVDIFEHYIDNLALTFRINIRSRITPKISAEHCFDKLAKISYRVQFKKSFFRDMLYMLGIKKLGKKTHKKLHRTSNKLLFNTIIYSAAILLLFFRKTRKARVKTRIERFKEKTLNRIK
jgi:hypothetical protein